MERSVDFTQKIIDDIELNEFDNATILITNIKDEDDERYDTILGSLVKLFSRDIVPKEKIPGIIKQIVTIYDQTKDSPNKLKEQLDTLLSGFGLVTGKMPENQKLVELSSWTDMQLKDKIKEIQQEQQNLLKTGKDLNPKIGQQLNKLLEEQSKRLGYKGKVIDETDEEDQQPEETLEGAGAWFVVPSEQELQNKVKTRVVCGSPIINIFRSRYMLDHKIKKILDINLNNLTSLSADDAYEMKRESSKQKDFVSNYLDPTLVIDQDICADEIASEFMTDKYTKPEFVRIDDKVSCYIFKSGYLKDSFSSNTAQHSFSVEGNVVGRFAICLNRKEPDSGRFISDSYDIVEFQDGQPCLYFYSSKGVSALSNKMVESIKTASRNASFNLTIPNPTSNKTMSKEDIESFISNYRQGKPFDLSQNKESDHNDITEKKDSRENISTPERKSEEITSNTDISKNESVNTTDNQDWLNEDSVPVDIDISELLEPEEQSNDINTRIEEKGNINSDTEIQTQPENMYILDNEEAERENATSTKEENSDEINQTKNNTDTEDQVNNSNETSIDYDNSQEEESLLNDAEETTIENDSGDIEENLRSRIDRLEKIAVNSLEALDKMEKKISKLDEFIDIAQKNINSTGKAKSSPKNKEKAILKKRAEVIKKSIKKKKNQDE